jgi:hypothetical protein
VTVRITAEIEPEAPMLVQALPEAGWTRAYATPRGPVDWQVTYSRELRVSDLPLQMPDALFRFGNRELGRIDLANRPRLTPKSCS